MEQKTKLYLNMIIKDSEPLDIIKRSLDSVKDYVDGMYLTITYTDTLDESSPLVSLLKEYGAELSFFKWIDDFSVARQYALDQIPKSKDTWVYWQDADDVLQGGEYMHEALDQTIRYGYSGVFFIYWYRVILDAEGNVKEIVIEHQRERIIQNDGTYKWRGMLHETLIGQRQENFRQYLFDKCKVVHLTTNDRVDGALARNLTILENQLAIEKHRDPRTLIYLGKAYFDKAVQEFSKTMEATGNDETKATVERDLWFGKAMDLFEEYLHGKGELGEKDYLEGSGWDEERASAYEYIAQIYTLRGDIQKGLQAITQAIEIVPYFPQFYIAKARMCAYQRDYKKAKHWLTIATNIEMPKTTLMLSPRDMKVRSLECDAHIQMSESNLKQVILDYEMLLQIDPENAVYMQNLRTTQSLQAANQASQSIVYLGRYLTEIGEEDKVLPLIQAVPTELQKEPFYAQMRHKHIPPRMWETDEITIICGPGFETWTPKSIETGIGGSEEAVIYLTRELARLGWKITVYANPGSDEGDYEGVTYLNYFKLNQEDLFNHLILWRAIGFADLKPRVRGKTLLWLHDMPNIPDFTHDRLSRIDQIAVLSEFHRDQIREYNPDGDPVVLPPEKFFITSNGIPDLGAPDPWVGNPHAMCWTSSYDRGIIYLLKHWKAIRTRIPDAELHIYYGWDLYDFIHRNNPARREWKEKVSKMMIQEGITHHGRVNHVEITTGMAACGVWAYPTDFTEISCISAMRAQAVGAVPCVTNFAALTETVRNGVKVDVDIQDKEGQAIYVKALCDLLLDPVAQAELRDIPWAQDHFSWRRVAKEWDAKLTGRDESVNYVLTPSEFLEQQKRKFPNQERKQKAKEAAQEGIVI